MKSDIHTIEAKTAGSVELADHIFGLDPRTDILHRVVQWQLNKRQQGTHQAKSRGEINRTTQEAGQPEGWRHGPPRFAQVGHLRGRRQGFRAAVPQP